MGKDQYNPYRTPRPKRVIVPPYIPREVVPREVWNAAPPDESIPMVPTDLPVENVIFTYDTRTDQCQDSESCHRILRRIQSLHMSSGLPDIAFNFLIGGDLKIYEGRGWDFKPEKHKLFPDLYDNSIEIAFIGNHIDTEGEEMSKLMTEALFAVELGVEAKNVTKFFRLQESTPKMRLETLGSDERPWKHIKRKSDLTLDDPADKKDIWK